MYGNRLDQRLLLRACILAVFFGLVCNQTIARGDATLLERFKHEAPAAWGKLAAALSKVDIECRRLAILKKNSEAPRVVWDEVFSVKQNGPRLLEVRTEFATPRSNTRVSGGPTTSRASCVTPAGAFSLARTGEAEWVVRDIERNLDLVGDPNLDEAALFARQPVVFFGYDMVKLARDRRFVVENVEPAKAEGNNRAPLVRVDFKYLRNPSEENGAGLVRGWLELDPARDWAIVRYAIDTVVRIPHGQSGMHVEGQNEYFEQEGSLPPRTRLAKCHWTANVGKDTYLNRMTYDFTKFEFADVPDTDFDLTAFGVRTSLGKGASPAVLRAVAFGITATVFIALAILLMLRHRATVAGRQG
jgi:hypothetical protein